jgi:hypothetical protein
MEGDVAEVLCVVRTICEGGVCPLVRVADGLRLTPHHPVLKDGEWRFPCDLATVQEEACDAIYSFVLQGAPALLVGGLPCVAMGHGLEEGAAQHAYFGTDCVLRDLALFPGYQRGHVELPLGCAIRDAGTGHVYRLRAPVPAA